MRLKVAAFSLMIALGLASLADAGDDLRLVEAVKRRDRTAVAALLRQVDVNARQPDGSTALHWAAHWDDLETAALLIGAGADVNVANDYGMTPLLLASTDASAAMIEKLLNARANPNAALPTGESALMAAARAGKAQATQLLLARGADVNATETTHGQTALMWAVAEQHTDVVTTLIDRGADVHALSAGGFTPLLFAAREGNIEIVRLLLSRGAGVNETAVDGSTPLLVATVRGHIPLALFLLDRGADPNAEAAGYTALHWASGRWQTTFTPFYAQTPLAGQLFWVPPDGKHLLIAALLSHGANPNARLKKDPPRYGTSLFTQSLRQHQMGATPFYLAAMVGDTDVMRLLLANGADPLIPADDDTTPLIAAAGLSYLQAENVEPESSHLAAVKLLVELGASVNAANNEGDGALHGTAFAGFDTIARFVIDNGARLNVKNKKGQTPLRVAEGIEFNMMIYAQKSTAEIIRKSGGLME